MRTVGPRREVHERARNAREVQRARGWGGVSPKIEHSALAAVERPVCFAYTIAHQPHSTRHTAHGTRHTAHGTRHTARETCGCDCAHASRGVRTEPRKLTPVPANTSCFTPQPPQEPSHPVHATQSSGCCKVSSGSKDAVSRTQSEQITVTSTEGRTLNK